MDDFRIFVSEHFFRTIFLFLESHRSSKHLLHDVNKLNRYSFIFFVYRSWIFITSIVLFSNLFSFQAYITGSNHPLESFPIKSYHRLEKLRPYRRTTRKTRWIRVNQLIRHRIWGEQSEDYQCFLWPKCILDSAYTLLKREHARIERIDWMVLFKIFLII